MKYINAYAILPDALVKELQTYIQAGYLYVPAGDGQRRAWGELSGCRKELQTRNETIAAEHKLGVSMEELAGRYHLSVHTIRKIIYEK